jgi:predicted O-methyltransferase YrrM
LRDLAARVKGFLREDEGLLLYELALEAATRGPCLEVGSYCGKSSLYLGAACRAAGKHPLFSVDHHRGSAEQQPGQEYYDQDLCDVATGGVDTLPHFRRNIEEARLEEWIIPLLASSARLAPYWCYPLGLVFIDGGHGQSDVEQDFAGWAPRLARGGHLCMHDLHADPRDGGQAPYEVFNRARRTRAWSYVTQVGSLGVLRRRWGRAL